MSSTKKIKFVCPKCQCTKLWAQRKEVIYHDVCPVIDFNEKLDIREMIEEKDFVATSHIILVCCQQCGYTIAQQSASPTQKDLAEELVDWLEEHNMLEDTE
jgi:hypothetical protein